MFLWTQDFLYGHILKYRATESTNVSGLNTHNNQTKLGESKEIHCMYSQLFRLSSRLCVGRFCFILFFLWLFNKCISNFTCLKKTAGKPVRLERRNTFQFSYPTNSFCHDTFSSNIFKLISNPAEQG